MNSWRDEALVGRLPLLRDEREYSTRGILATGFAYSVATWCFLIGGYAANVIDARRGTVALICGSVIGITFSAGAAALGCNRYGLEQIDFTKPCFGQRGSQLVLVFYLINQIGWTGVVLVMFGRGVQNVLAALGWDGGENLLRLVVLAGLLLAVVIVIRGIHILNLFNTIATPGLLLVSAALFYVLLHDHGWADIVSRAPLAAPGDTRLSYLVAFEFGLGAGFSWWPGVGFLMRNADSQRNSFYPQVLTMGLCMGLVCCIGLFAGLVFRTYDPTVWMVQAGGPALGALALGLVAIANVSASALMLYTAALALRHVTAMRGWPWARLAGLSALPVLFYVLWPTALYDRGNAFLTYNATMFAPISGILLADYWLLRRGALNMSQIFEGHPAGHYWFVSGFNPLALVCMGGGQALYIWLLDPVSSTPHGPVLWTTASGPAVLVPMLLYYVLMRWGLMRRGLGGYRAPTAPLPLRRPNI